ncbi:MAG: hypothetical protein KDI92_01770 [Xanthomonadales bacterium]|nr:hypothetical protein [Xanthomonadales bacterium]
MMNYKAYFYSTCLNLDVASEHAVEMNLDQFCKEIIPNIKDDRDFCGLIDSSDNALQTIYEEEHEKYWVEVPRPDLQGSYGLHMSEDSVINLFKSLTGEDFPLQGFAHFTFSKW